MPAEMESPPLKKNASLRSYAVVIRIYSFGFALAELTTGGIVAQKIAGVCKLKLKLS